MIKTNDIFFYLVLFISAAIFSVLINGLFLKFARTLGIRNTNNKETVIRWGSTSKPAFGGISFYIVFLVSFVIIAFKGFKIDTQLLGIFISSTIGFLIGLADDAYNTKPLLKFLGQVLCAIILVATGTTIDLFDNSILNIGLTVLWIVGMMNSINMLDNMDAITTSVSINVLIAVTFIFLIQNNWNQSYFVLSIGVIAALVGFLYYNWHPSKMYMGDTGSQFLGAFLGAMGILFIWNFRDINQYAFAEGASYEVATDVAHITKRILMVGLVFLIPLIDTTTVTINRLARRQSPFVGGKDHTTHHLSYMGLNDRHVAIVFWVISLASLTLFIYAVKFPEKWTTATISLYFSYCLILFGVLYSFTKRKKAKEKINNG